MRSKLIVVLLLITIAGLSSPVFAVPIPYNGHWYYIVPSGTDGSWINAENNAIALGGHLVTINDAAEEAWLRANFGDSTRYWIGFNDAAVEGTWVWSSGEPITYTNWDAGEPSNHTPPAIGEDYAVLNWDTIAGGWNDFDHQRPDYYQIYGIAEFDVFIVDIDIKPGSFPNSINLKSKGVIPVAILTTSIADGDSVDFDATTVNAATVKFFGHCGGASMAHKDAHLEDVDNDGDVDMVIHFRTQETHISASDTEARLEGETVDGMPFVGTDSIMIVPKD